MMRPWTVSNRSSFWWQCSSLPSLLSPWHLPYELLYSILWVISHYSVFFPSTGLIGPSWSTLFREVPVHKPYCSQTFPSVSVSWPYLGPRVWQEKVEWMHAHSESFFIQVLLHMQNRVRAAFISDLLRLLFLHLLGGKQDSELTRLISHGADDRVACLCFLASPALQGLPQSFSATDSPRGFWGILRTDGRGFGKRLLGRVSIADPGFSSVRVWSAWTLRHCLSFF